MELFLGILVIGGRTNKKVEKKNLVDVKSHQVFLLSKIKLSAEFVQPERVGKCERHVV